MPNLFDFEWYAPHVLKIQTKTSGLRPFHLMKYQRQYIEHLKENKSGIIRSIVLKARQCGFSTLVSGYNIHRMMTQRDYKTIVLADKSSRTDDVINIYKRFVSNTPERLRPMIYKNNDRELFFDNPNEAERVSKPGLGSGLRAETALDPFAGRAGTRSAAHLTECAFYRYSDDIDEGIQNSIPLAKGTYVVKESTAHGMAGLGESFYNLWCAAERGDTIYRPFFVSWYSVDNYALEVPHGFAVTKEERELLKRCPDVTTANLVWRRMKIMEYASSTDSIFSPSERFCQDYPSYPDEAFLHSGQPVFDVVKLRAQVQALRITSAKPLKIKITQEYLSMYPSLLTVFIPPKEGIKYSIGADVAEGVEFGDSSSAFIMDENMNQCAVFHGKIDPDHFGIVLTELAKIYNNAILVPEMNNMGYATLTAIKNSGYRRVYSRSIIDEIADDKVTDKIGWRTTKQSKQTMLNGLVAAYRDDSISIQDINLLREMLGLTRESNGDVSLTGNDRTVAACLAIVGLTQLYERARVIDLDKKEILQLESKDLYMEKKHHKVNW